MGAFTSSLRAAAIPRGAEELRGSDDTSTRGLRAGGPAAVGRAGIRRGAGGCAGGAGAGLGVPLRAVRVGRRAGGQRRRRRRLGGHRRVLLRHRRRPPRRRHRQLRGPPRALQPHHQPRVHEAVSRGRAAGRLPASGRTPGLVRRAFYHGDPDLRGPADVRGGLASALRRDGPAPPLARSRARGPRLAAQDASRREARSWLAARPLPAPLRREARLGGLRRRGARAGPARRQARPRGGGRLRRLRHRQRHTAPGRCSAS